MASISAHIDGRIGRIILDRPRALNALDLDMIRGLAEAVRGYTDNPAVHAIVMEGAGGRAFCAGGDVRTMRQAALAGDTATIQRFFTEEYALNLQIARCPKPYVSLVDGVCMGGGIGISAHGRILVATEAALFAMPETAIGFFPDVGTSFLLPRLPGQLGMFLGLAGARVAGGDAIHAGLATHYVPRARLPALSAALARDGVGAVALHAEPPPPFSLAAHRAAIDRCFGEGSIGAIGAALHDEGDWGAEVLAMLRPLSPNALRTTFQLLREGAGRSLEQCLAAELALVGPVTAHPDFAEGVRAVLVDKDRAPVWKEGLLF